ncbi:chaperonin 10-like protein [Cokeromyces recurvatus]|uniref:chaperonin 10-like protein n=1 Tax=Cokeromyces recurvatus TaxID=90255 RepID=UPI00221F4E3C|nr:chaperonin 10-like protein [Cokeromyces recurvatus]KAI7900313.1 chaperonin 10-like protein [Cokeromyces recurvatus]
MHGIQLVKYGSPKESLVYKEDLPIPKIKSPHEVLVRIKAAGVNPVDAKVASGNIKFSTFIISVPSILGADFAGIIVEKGAAVTEFEVGDEVFGSLYFPSSLNGTYAQYTVVDITKASIAKKPQHLSFEQAASAGIAVLTAYQGIVKNGHRVETHPHEKRKILIAGASGGVGSYGVQLAKTIYAENTVVGICSGKNIEFVKSLGADQVIDYKDEVAYKSFITEEKDTFDIIFDCVGGEDYYRQLDPLLKKNGVYSTAVGPIEHIGSNHIGLFNIVSIISKVGYKKIFAPHTYAVITTLPNADFRNKIAPLFEAKAIHGTVHEDSNIIPLTEGYKAHERLLTHRTVGKIVLKID